MIVALMLGIPYLTALALLCAEIAGVRTRKLPALPQLPATAWIAAIVVTYAIQLADYRYAATHGASLPAWRLTMPLPVVYLDSANADASAALLLLCGTVQSFAMLALFRSRPSNLTVVLAAAALIGLSLAAPAITSGDLYSNVGYALLGNRAYAPPAVPFSGDYAVINRWWGTPIVPAPYGPAWLAIDRAVTAISGSLAGKLLALRCFCALLFVCGALLLRALSMPRRYFVITLLNPGLLLQFVANAHNDIVAIVAIVAAAVFLRRDRYLLAAALLVFAGTLKLPYAILALPVLAAIVSPVRRWLTVLAVVALAASISLFFGGTAFVRALVTHAEPMGSAGGWHAAAVAIALVLVAAALAGKRRLQSAVWLLPPVGGFFPAFVYPWYLAWGLPYALNRHRNLAYLLMLFPFVAVLVDQLFVRVWTLVFVFPVVGVTAFYFSALPATRQRT